MWPSVRLCGTRVAVGTAITDRPRTDPYVQSYRIRLLPNVETDRSAVPARGAEPA
jgi:hypothetical protein